MSEQNSAGAQDFESRFSFLESEELASDIFLHYQFYFLHQIIRDIEHDTRIARAVMYHLETVFLDEGIKFKGGIKGESKRRYSEIQKKENFEKLSDADWKLVKDFCEQKAKSTEFQGNFIEQNVNTFLEEFSLPPHIAQAILLMRTMNDRYGLGETVKEILNQNSNRYGLFISKIIPELSVEQRKDIVNLFLPSSDLIRKGIVEFPDQETDDDGDLMQKFPYINGEVQEFLIDPELTKEKIRSNVLGEPIVKPEFTIENFPQYKNDIAEIIDIVRGAIEAGEKGINILLFGPAGVGKTALAAAIAGALELELYTIGEQNPDEDDDPEYKNGSATSKFRIGKLQQAHALLKDTRKAALFFDEIEDVLNKGTDSSKKPDVFSKILFNRLLETNPIVTIWAGNDLDKFHESVLQRFSYSLAVGQAPTMMRREIWMTQAKKNDVKIDDADLLQLARDFVAPPRIIGKALNNARLSSRTDIKTITGFIEKASLITYGSEDELRHNSGLSRYFSRDLLPPELVAEVDEWIKSGGKDKPASIFINAIRGAGVNAFAEEIAERLIMHPLSINAHDLSADSMQISAVDKIKRAFSAAARGNALLSIQNIEAFNEDPNNPQGRWRNDLISQFVRSASEHGLPFVASTMKPDVTLPPTLKPIFTINGEMGALSSEQVATATKIYFGIDLPKEIDEKAKLVPADFSMARKISTKLPQEPTPEQIMEMVMTQARARQESGGAKIGF